MKAQNAMSQTETRWTDMKENNYKKAAEEVLGYRKKQSKPWISATS